MKGKAESLSGSKVSQYTLIQKFGHLMCICLNQNLISKLYISVQFFSATYSDSWQSHDNVWAVENHFQVGRADGEAGKWALQSGFVNAV